MNVGDYIRTINGEIYKLIDDFSLIYFQKEQEHGIPEHQIIKSSPNIIDLIEVGDYVNGKLVAIVNDTSKCTGSFYQPNVQCRQDEVYDYEQIFDDEIKSIVTKEQFSQMEYKVGE